MVGQGHIGLVADAADQRHRHGADRAHDVLVVEGPEVFQRTTAATQDRAVHLIALRSQGQCRTQRGRRLRPLHHTWIDKYLHMRRTARQRRHDIAQRRRAERGDHAQPARVGRHGPLQRRIEQAFGFEPRLQIEELFEQRARACTLHGLDHQLQLASWLVHAQPTSQLDQLTILRREVQQHGSATEHRTAQQGRIAGCVFQVEVTVAAGGPGKARHLAANRTRTEARGQCVGHRLYQRGDTPDKPRRRDARQLIHRQTQAWSGSAGMHPHGRWAGGSVALSAGS